MRIIAKSRLHKYWEIRGNEKSEPYLAEWYHFCLKQDWHTAQDIKNTFGSASFVANNRVVFNVKGNDYRIICALDYTRQALFIKFVGTHKEYNKIKANEVERL
ncbi:putative membrane protein [hydrothermal vent metagenome]|uniref:Putative membrane protein n=1 Tax=hydrothermal vent metagenome TaxID=652676 RepID=A0A3B0XEP5_9ZZZZ